MKLRPLSQAPRSQISPSAMGSLRLGRYLATTHTSTSLTCLQCININDLVYLNTCRGMCQQRFIPKVRSRTEHKGLASTPAGATSTGGNDQFKELIKQAQSDRSWERGGGRGRGSASGPPGAQPTPKVRNLPHSFCITSSGCCQAGIDARMCTGHAECWGGGRSEGHARDEGSRAQHGQWQWWRRKERGGAQWSSVQVTPHCHSFGSASRQKFCE